MKHTKGPWTIVDEKNEHGEPQQFGLYVTSGHGGADVIAQIVRQGVPWPCAQGLETDEANARLVAASPALAEALRGFMGCIARDGTRCPPNPEDCAAARAALALLD